MFFTGHRRTHPQPPPVILMSTLSGKIAPSVTMTVVVVTVFDMKMMVMLDAMLTMSNVMFGGAGGSGGWL